MKKLKRIVKVIKELLKGELKVYVIKCASGDISQFTSWVDSIFFDKIEAENYCTAMNERLKNDALLPCPIANFDDREDDSIFDTLNAAEMNLFFDWENKKMAAEDWRGAEAVEFKLR